MLKKNKTHWKRYCALVLLCIMTVVCTAVFLTASAAEDEGQNGVSSSDVSSVELTMGADGKLYMNRPGAVYETCYRDQLTELEQVFYDLIYDATMVKQKKGTYYVDISRFRLLKSDSNYLFAAVFSADYAFCYDNPEAFWFRINSTSESYSGDFIKGISIEIIDEYPGAYNDRSKVQNGIDSAVSQITARRASDSRYDTVRAIHDYICDTTTYDYGALRGEDQGAAGCVGPFFGGGKRGNQVVCEGYSRVFKLLCKKFDIPAVVVTGMGHAWNYVQMEDGKWYGIDTTWDDGQDTSPPQYTYFLAGSNRGGPRYFYDHIPEGDMINSGGIAAPAVYPELSKESYVPNGGFYFYGECSEDGREVSGTTVFTWKCKGNAASVGTVRLYSYDDCLGSYQFDDGGTLRVELDSTRLGSGSCQIKLESDAYSDYRYVTVKNKEFEILNWQGEKPTLSGVYTLSIKGYSTGNIRECMGSVYIDNQFYFNGNFNSSGLLTYSVNTQQLTNADHTLKIYYCNSWGKWRSVEKSFRVYNYASPGQLIFWGSSAENGRMVGDTVAFTLKYGGLVPSGSRLNVYLDNISTQVFYLNTQSVAEAFDSDGFCTFYLDLSGQSNGTHNVRAELVPNGGSTASASVDVTVSDGYLVFTDWAEELRSVSGTFEIKTKKLYEESGVSCGVNTYLDGKLLTSGSMSDGVSFNIVNGGNTIDSTYYSDGEHYFSFVFETSNGIKVEKGKRFRIGNNDPLRFCDAESIKGRIYGDLAQFRIQYNGAVTDGYSLNTYIDDVPVQARFLNSAGIAEAFDESGIGRFYINLNGQSEGDHTLKAVLTRDDGSSVEVSVNIAVSNGYFSFYNWSSSNPVYSSNFTFRLKNTSGINGDNCRISEYVDDKSICDGIWSNNIYSTTGLNISNYSNGEHLLRVVFRTNTGKTVEKSKLFTVNIFVPDFSFNTLGASIRLTDPYGIRFGIRIDKNADFKKATIVEYGTLIIPTSTLGNQELNYYTDKVLKIKANNILENDASHITYTGVLINIPESFFDTNIKGRGYLIYKDSNGNSRIVYSQTVERSFNGVARAAYDSYSRIENPTEEQIEIIEKLKAILKI